MPQLSSSVPVVASVTASSRPPRYDKWPVAMQYAFHLRGALLRCGPGFRGAGWPETPCVRLCSLGSWLGQGRCASHLTAAWVWDASDEPGTPLSIAALAGRRGTLNSLENVRKHELRLATDEVQAFEDLWVTTPLRTAVDLLHDSEVFSAQQQTAVSRLMRQIPGGKEHLLACLSARRRPHRRLAESRLSAILDSDHIELTR